MANTERMKMPPTLPGTSAQQALLRSIIDAYNGDQRVLAIGVLGSLGRGTWDEWSDLDLDVVVTDEAVLDAVSEAQALCGVLHESEVLVVPSRPGEVDVVLPSLDQFSIRFHTLGTTNAHIIDDLKIVKRGELRAVHVYRGRRKGLRIELPAPLHDLFSALANKEGGVC
jgi:predicted nucleotidyltransferase